MTYTGLYAGLNAEEFSAWEAKARAVAAQLSETALERDRANRDPVAEIGWLRESGLLGLAAPRALGGAGANLLQALRISRIIAAADGSIGQLIAYHYSNGVWTYILGRPEQWERTTRAVAAEGWFQGGVSNPRDEWAPIERAGGRRFISGKRTFATGSSVAQVLTVSLWDGDERVHYQIPPDRAGISFGDDWDNLGQRLTASGGITFDRVELFEEERLSGLDDYAGDVALRDGLRSLFSQVIFAHFYLGIAEGALAAAADHTRRFGRVSLDAGVERVTDDPYHLLLFGRLSAGIAAGIALADKAVAQYQLALEAGPALTPDQWGELALVIDQAKVVANDVVLDVTTRIYEATGARSTASRYGLDIFWRNARTHTVHDPVAYRAREIGAAVLAERLPTPRRPRPAAAGPTAS